MTTNDAIRRLVARSAVLLSLLAPAALSEEKLPKWKAGEHEGSVQIDGKEEAFVALVPQGYSPKKEWPVVLLAHGNGGKAKDFLMSLKPMAGKKPPLLISLERCDNLQDAVGYMPKYLAALKARFSIDTKHVYGLGFSGGGFRLWDDILCNAEAAALFRAVVLVGCGKQSFEPVEKPEGAHTVVFVGDPKDGNYGKSRPDAAESLRKKGWEVLVHEHDGGHTVPRKETEAVFTWIAEQIRAKPKTKP